MADDQQAHAELRHHSKPLREFRAGELGLCAPAESLPVCCVDAVATAGEAHNPSCEGAR